MAHQTKPIMIQKPFIKILHVALLFLGAFITTASLKAQEIKSTVQVVAPRVTMTDKQILITLQTAAQQFINTRKWTDENIAQQEKIELSLFIDITAINNNEFSGTLQFQVVRPVFNSTYKTLSLIHISEPTRQIH
jgi:hypothetical protein